MTRTQEINIPRPWYMTLDDEQVEKLTEWYQIQIQAIIVATKISEALNAQR